MNFFHPQTYFDLASFEHAKIFDGCEFVWDAVTKIQTYLEKRSVGLIQTDVPQGTFVVNPELITIGEGSIIEPGAYIKGPCIIGKNCSIRHGAYIRGNVIIGDHCVIGHGTEIKQTIFLDHVHAAHFAYLGDSILGNRVNLGAGTKCANLKLNRELIEISIEGKKTKTGLKKLGAIIGDHSQLGCNSVTNPGTLIGKNVLSFPCLNLGGVIPSNSLVQLESKLIIKNRDTLTKKGYFFKSA